MRRAHFNPKKLDQRYRLETARQIEGMTATELTVLKELIDRGGKHGYCFVTFSRLAHDTKLSTKTIQRVMKRLEALGVLRSWHSIKSDGKQGCKHFAITLPVFLDVHFNGQTRSDSGDTESTHNIKIQHKPNKTAYRIPILERQIFEIMLPVLDRVHHPDLICLYDLRVWLFNNSDTDWDALEQLVLNQAQDLAKLLQNARRRLTGWSFFIDLLDEAGDHEGATISRVEADAVTQERVLAFLVKAATRRQGNYINYLDDCKIEFEGEVIVINFKSEYCMNQISDGFLKEIRTLANNEGRPVAIACAKFERRRVLPENYG